MGINPNNFRRGLSTVIIAKNAEKTIARCLQSVATLSDEVILVINDCTDDTKPIADSYGATVIEHQWEGFRDQKNFAINMANHEWILSLDADEALSCELKHSIGNFMKSQSSEYVGVRFARMTFLVDKWIAHGDWYPDYVLRLFKKGCGTFVGGSVHEKLEVSGKVCTISGNILHHSCESLLEFTRKNILYADMAAADMFNRGEKASLSLTVLKSYWRFFRCFILKLGFLDWATGFYLAKMQGFLALYKYAKLHSLVREKETYT
jgi:glycosyltransferase involved in cell wall biosynthesis